MENVTAVSYADEYQIQSDLLLSRKMQCQTKLTNNDKGIKTDQQLPK
jgi:hypothetical protein